MTAVGSLESQLAMILVEVLGLDVVDPVRSLASYGVDSLGAVELQAALRTRLGKEVELGALLGGGALEKLAELVARSPAVVPSTRGSTERPLSIGQRALLVADELEPGRASYNISLALRLERADDGRALERALRQVIAHHEALRATTDEDGTHWVVHDEAPSGWWRSERAGDVEAQIAAVARMPFDLRREAPLRAVLLEDDAPVLVIGLHHVATDLWSMALFAQQLGDALAGEREGRGLSWPRSTLEVGREQAEWLATPVGRAQLEAWAERLGGELPSLALPTDRARRAEGTGASATLRFEVDAETTSGLRALARHHDASLVAVLLAIDALLLARHGGQREVVIGVPTYNRSRADRATVVVYLVNVLPLRVEVDPARSFDELVAHVRDRLVELATREDTPLASIVERLAMRGAPFRTTLTFQRMPAAFPTAFAQIAAGHETELDLGGLRVRATLVDARDTSFELSLVFAEVDTRLVASLEYATALFERGTIERLLESWSVLVRAIVADASTELGRLPLVSPSERARLLDEWNGDVDDAPDELLHELFVRQATRTPDAIAVTCAEKQTSYRELDERSSQLANVLVARGLVRGERVGIVAGRSAALVEALVAVPKAGCAYVALDGAWPAERTVGIARRLGLRALIVDAEQLSNVEKYVAAGWVPEVVVRLDDASHASVSRLAPSTRVTPEDPAYVIHTSGSSGEPKGVLVAHGAATRLVRWVNETFEVGPHDRLLFVTSICFDLSVYDVFGILAAGGTVRVASSDELAEPERLVEALERDGITIWDSAPAALQRLAPLFEDHGSRALRLVLLSGDWIPLGLPDEARASFPNAEVVSLGGATEATVWSNYYRVGTVQRQWSSIPYGYPITNARYYALDGSLEPVPLGVVGELYIGGRCLAVGYDRAPSLTAERFIPDPHAHAPGARMYRTGDLVRRGVDGCLEFMGRADAQVKVRGFRIELGEIESALIAAERVRFAAVVALGTPLDRKLVAYVVGDATEAELKTRLRATLPEYMIPGTFVMLDALPLTPNGKLDRKALPSPELQVAPYVAPSNERERVIAAVWSEVLGVARVGAQDDFFALGGHSLLATQVVSKLRAKVGVELPLRALFEAPTLAALAERLAIGPTAAVEMQSIPRVAREGVHPLSPIEEQVWFRNALDPRGGVLNMNGVLRLEGELDADVVQRVIDAIVERHESLRTRFISSTEGPRAVVMQAARVVVPRIDASALDAAERERVRKEVETRQLAPFDLEQGPIFRVDLVRLGAREHELYLSLHHIVGDGRSIAIFVGDFVELYTAFVERRAPALSPLPLQPIDFAHWQAARDEATRRQAHAYWVDALRGVVPQLALPLDHASPADATHELAALHRPVPAELLARLDGLARRHGVTPYMLFLAAFDCVLARSTRQDDVLVGTAMSSRSHVELEHALGAFTLTLPIRVRLAGDPTFVEVLARTRTACLDAFTYQDVPFEDVVRELRVPLGAFNVCCLLEDQPWGASIGLPGLALSAVDETATQRQMFELVLAMVQEGQGTTAVWRYRKELFERSTVMSFAEAFEEVLRAVAADPGRRVSELPLLDASGQRRALRAGNAHAATFPKQLLVHEAFEQQVDRDPDALALTFEDRHLTYAELERRANALAHELVARGVGPGVLVGLCLERSLELGVALLAVLKAGGGYVPIDPAYPPERIAFTLEDARVALLLTHAQAEGRVPSYAGPKLDVDEPIARADRLPRRGSPQSPAYVIYTSGSTWRPKGVVIPHENVARLLSATQRWFEFGPSDVWTVFHSYAFDFSVWELWGALMTGGRAVIVSRDTARSPGELWRLIERERVTVLDQTPSSFRQLIATEPATLDLRLRYVIFGGEALEPASLRPFVARHGLAQPRLVNMYGITETTVHVTYRALDERALADGASVIGVPIPDLSLYVLSEHLEPVPVAFPGELCVGGAGLAHGYLGRPELTAERFVPNPYGPPGSRLYRSGDLARRRHDGELVYLGRIDTQVKIRGFRIEPQEIERALAAEPGVREVVVVAREDVPGDARLVAYVVSEVHDADALREAAKRTLPAHMLPSAIVFLDALPLTENGKLNRRALPTAATSQPERVYVAPSTADERLLAELCARLLHVERVGLSDNFFDLGGHSLLLTQLASHIQVAFHVEVPLRVLFDAPTVADMAFAILCCQVEQAPDPSETAELLEELEGLSPEEIRALLLAEGE